MVSRVLPGAWVLSGYSSLLVLPLLLVWVVLIYSPGTSGGFLFDDFPNIVHIPELRVNALEFEQLRQAWNAGIASAIGRPVAVITFALDHYFAGELSAVWAKWVNIFIHTFNGLLVYLLMNRILTLGSASGLSQGSRKKVLHGGAEAPAPRKSNIPLLIAAAWLLHPLQVSSVLYVVQRMNLMAALFCLISMLIYVEFRSRSFTGVWRLPSACLLLALPILAAVLSKENAALVMVYMLLLELMLFRFSCKTIQDRWFIGLIFGAGLVIPAIGLLSVLVTSPDTLLGGYAARSFDLETRVLTQARVFWIYVGWILWPDISAYGIHHDDIHWSSGIFQPWTTATSLVALAFGALFLAFRLRRLGPVVFGLTLFVSGHMIESTILPLEMVFEHRNYLPSLGIICALTVGAGRILKQYPRRPFWLDKCAPVVVILLLSSLTFARATNWGDTLLMHYVDMSNHPDSARAHHSYASALLGAGSVQQNYEVISHHYAESSRLDGEGVGGLQGQLVLDTALEKKFSAQMLDELSHRLSTAIPRAETLILIDALISHCQRFNCGQHNLNEKLVGFVDDMLSNPALPSRSRGDYLVLKARCLANFNQDVTGAIASLTEAIERDPENRPAHFYRIEFSIRGKSPEKKRQLIEQFASTKIAQNNPALVQELRREFLRDN